MSLDMNHRQADISDSSISSSCISSHSLVRLVSESNSPLLDSSFNSHISHDAHHEHEQPSMLLSSSSSSPLLSATLLPPPPPPVQILCHALSWIIQQEVHVVLAEPSTFATSSNDTAEADNEAGTTTWGGAGWNSSLPPGSSTTDSTMTTADATHPTTIATTQISNIQLAFHRLYHLYHPNNDNNHNYNDDKNETIIESLVAAATSSDNSNIDTTSLALSDQQEEEEEEEDDKVVKEWKAVLAAFSDILRDPELVVSSSSSSSSPTAGAATTTTTIAATSGWTLTNMKQAAQRHHRAEWLLRNRGYPLIKWWTPAKHITSNNSMTNCKASRKRVRGAGAFYCWPFVSLGIKMYQKWILEQVVTSWLGPPDGGEMTDNNDEGDDTLPNASRINPPSSADSSQSSSRRQEADANTNYEETAVTNTEIITSPSNSSRRDGINELIVLLENDNIETIAFLDGLFQAYQDRYQERLLEKQEKEGTATSSSSFLFLAHVLLRRCILGLRTLMMVHHDKDATASSIMILICRRLAACTRLCNGSEHVLQALVHCFEKEELTMRLTSESGQTKKLSLLIQPLCLLAAYTIQDGATQLGTTATTTAGDAGADAWEGDGRTLSNPFQNLFLLQSQTIANYPLCVYSKSHNSDTQALRQLVKECHANIGLMRQVAVTVVSKALAKNKRLVLQWLATVISKHLTNPSEALLGIISWAILGPRGAALASSTPTFLLGLASIVLKVCSFSMMIKFEKQGVSAFDYQYLVQVHPEFRFGDKALVATPPDDEQQHQHQQHRHSSTETPIRKFGVATELFFLTSALLRVGLFPALYIDEAFHLKRKELLAMHHQTPQLSPPHEEEKAANPITSAQGSSIFFSEPEFVSTMTDFALLQLRWLVALLTDDGTIKQHNSVALLSLVTIPEWMCKDPAHWLEYAARRTAQRLKPRQALAAVDCATELLQYGTNVLLLTSSSVNSSGGGGRAVFSRAVLMELIQVIYTFLQVGVSQNRLRSDISSESAQNEYAFDAYLLFEQNDLGVGIFNNHRRTICTKLCPTLVTAFGLLDQYSDKVVVCNVLLLLWSHPNGECRASLVRLPDEDIAQLASTVAAALGFLLEDAIHRFADVCQNQKMQSPDASITINTKDQTFAEAQAKNAANICNDARCLAILMCRLSQEEKLATIMGSSAAKSVCIHLANTMIHFVVNLLTTAEGGTKPFLEIMDNQETSWSMFLRSPGMTDIEKESLVTAILQSRHFAVREIGLDVAMLCRTFLALAARWHMASKGDARVSPILDAFASHDDCDILHLRNVYKRMVRKPSEPLVGTEMEHASTIFEYDGYVDATPWFDKYDLAPTTKKQQDRWRTARLSKLTTQEIEKVAQEADIQAFLNDLEVVMRSKSEASALVDVNVEHAHNVILTANANMAEEGYSECLAEWVVSSDSFVNASDRSTYTHYYGKTAKSLGKTGSGKQLVKEARRCLKGLPTPHSHSSSFVCFDDSRMDLCRAFVTGPSDTPYAHGVFVFDVFFPPTFPQIPPLVTFMTTGGGTTRFGPNLYPDGKVCLSLLGTYYALHDSERWQPGLSSLAQILLSIQTQLLTAEPYFNEPGFELVRGSAVGDNGSKRYNSGLRLATLRHSIISYLRSPPVGFEEVALRHFSMCQKRIVVQALRWMMEAEGTPLYPKFQKAYADILSLLLSMKSFQSFGSLPPLDDDVQVVRNRDPTLLRESIEVKDSVNSTLVLLEEKDLERKPSVDERIMIANIEQERERHDEPDNSQ